MELTGPRRTGRLDGLFVLSSLATGGTERKVVRVAAELIERGRRIEIAYLGAPESLRPTIPQSIPITNLGRRGKFSARALRNLVALLRQRRPNTVFAAQLYTLLYVGAAYHLTNDAVSRRIAMVNTTTFVRRRDPLFMRLYSPLLRQMDEVIFGCKAQHDDWNNRYRFADTPTSVVYNGVDTSHFMPRSDDADMRAQRTNFGLSADAIVLGTVGRLAPEKNQKALVDILKRLVLSGVNAELLLVGDGPKRAELVDQAARLGVASKVRFAGLLRDVRPALECMDVFLLPSTLVETFSNAALEAMASGCPVILSDIGGASELVREELDGIVVRPGDDEGLYTAALALCRDESRRRAMGRSARERVLASFGLSSMVDQYDRRLSGTGRRAG